MRVLIGHSRRKALTGQIRGYLGESLSFRVKCYFEPAISYLIGTTATMSGQALEGWSRGLPSARSYGGSLSTRKRLAYHAQFFGRGSLIPPKAQKQGGEQHLQTASGRRKIRAVGACKMPDIGTYRVGQEKGSHGADTGLFVKFSSER